MTFLPHIVTGFVLHAFSPSRFGAGSPSGQEKAGGWQQEEEEEVKMTSDQSAKPWGSAGMARSFALVLLPFLLPALSSS